MKFLLWQYAAYAFSAFALGLVVAYLWWRPRVARTSRRLASQHAQIGALQREVVEVQVAAQRDRNIVAVMALLTEQLSAARNALTLMEAELDASTIRHRALDKKTHELADRAVRQDALATDAQRAQTEALRIREALDRVIAERAAERAFSERALAEALARANTTEHALVSLRRSHELLVVESRRELTELSMEIERAQRSRNSIQSSAASSIWQAELSQQNLESPDDQMLIVLPNDDVSPWGGEPVGASQRRDEMLPSSDQSSRERSVVAAGDSSTGSTALATTQSPSDILIELRNS